ncbi:MAG TPA: T9SS type A sorting domain-containing protein [Bacteroidia bacterium]|nr:T9SS type A sorting domain-containing protein [Bacteroidia bacterium]
MRKKLLTSLFAVSCFGFSLQAQQAAYSFSQSTETYTDLTGATVISTPNWDDFDVYTLQLPFSFTYFGKEFSTIYAMGGFDGFDYDGAGTFGAYELYTFDNEMKDANGIATISTLVTGISPNRIFKIETQNANFESDNTEADFANLQLWLYETSNIIEIHYGPSSIANAKTFPTACAGPTIGLVKDQTAFLALSGAASNPTASATVPSICVTGAPPENKVYRFTPLASGIHELNNAIPITIYPNPSNGEFTIATESLVYANAATIVSVKNALGQEMYRSTISLSGAGQTIQTNLQAGMYFVQLENEKGYTVRKVVIE